MARGYTFAANQGLRAATGGYVVLLNSDTIVTLGWVEKLVACAESDPAIGLVGPLSNTASWQSIPEIEEDGDWAINALPSGVTIADMGSLIARHASHGYPRMSFLNGLLMFFMPSRRVIAMKNASCWLNRQGSIWLPSMGARSSLRAWRNVAGIGS